jgi:L-ascorbate metabolism protein UlaG (beta-lactamase superfamily)
VPSPLHHLAEIVRSIPSRGESDRASEQAAAELEGRAPELEAMLPAGLRVEWLGVSGYRLSYEGRALYIDPYFSRVPLSSLILRRRALPDEQLLDRYCPALPPGTDEQVVGVLVGHTHFDHAVDAPALARRFGCRAFGSASLLRLMALHGLAQQTVAVEPYAVYELGPFEVAFTPSRHSRLLLGAAVPFDGELTCDHLDGLSPNAYRCGQVWGIEIRVAGITLYHQGSADLIDDALRIRPGEVDVFLAGVAGRNFTERYWERILPKLDPRLVVPTHYDDFFAPLDQRLETIGNVRLADLPGEIGAVSGSAQLVALPRVTVDDGGRMRDTPAEIE